MKRNFKMVLCMLMAAIMIFSFTACKSDKGADTFGAETDDASASKATVESFMSALCSINFEEAKKYVETSVLEDVPFENLDEVKNQALEAMDFTDEMKPYKDQFIILFDEIINMALEKITYEIGEGEKQGNNYVYPVKISMPNFSVISDVDSKLGEEIVGEIGNELLTSGEISTDSSQEEIMAALMPKLFEKLTAIIEEMLDETEKTITEENVVVENKNGQWIITEGASVPDIGSALKAFDIFK